MNSTFTGASVLATLEGRTGDDNGQVRISLMFISRKGNDWGSPDYAWVL